MPQKPPITITHDGITDTLAGWQRRTGIPAETIRSRVNHQGWPVARALTEAVAAKFAKSNKKPTPAPKPCPPMKPHATGQGVVRWTVGGREHSRYMGQWGSDEAATAYRRFQMEWAASATPPTATSGRGLLVCELIERYLDHVERYYVQDGKPTSEQYGQRAAMRVLHALYHDSPARDFSPGNLRVCVQSMVEQGWARNTINQHTWRITRCFGWAAGQDIVPPDVPARLERVDRLQPGRTEAPDMPPVEAVLHADIETVIKHVEPRYPHRAAVLADLIRVHRLTGMRPGELCRMTPEAVDRRGRVWCYRLWVHKTTFRQIRKREAREIRIGPRAQAILGPRLDATPAGERVWRLPPRGPKGKRWTAITAGLYARYVRDVCEAAGVEPWHPHQLRHRKATDVQVLYECDDATAKAIGDTPEVARQVYAGRPEKAVAERIAWETG